MNKPRKKDCRLKTTRSKYNESLNPTWSDGYNQCHKEWKAYHEQVLSSLPDVEEIWDILIDVHGCKPKKEDCNITSCTRWGYCEILSKSIAKRIGRE